jgi:hypothetical protein
MKIDQVKVTFRGYAGHCCVSHKCLFHLNSLLEYKDKKIGVSTVGLYVPDLTAEYVKYEPLNATDSYFETMAFWSNYNKFNDYIKNKLGFNVQFLIEKHYNKFMQNKWFSIGDVLIKTETFRNFMEWFYPVYLDNNNSNYFAHHFERYLTVYCLLNDIQYEVKENETIHRQLKSHNYYN